MDLGDIVWEDVDWMYDILVLLSLIIMWFKYHKVIVAGSNCVWNISFTIT